MGLMRLVFAVMIGIMLSATAAWAAMPLPPLDAQSQCGTYSRAIEVVESGRWDDQKRASVAWPWTVSSGGDGKFFPTKAAAIAEVRRLKAAGITNIDVGCMQVNLMYHPDAFDSLDEAFEPVNNVGYAASFLTGLYQATNHWLKAASYYHSQTPSLAAEYRHKLEKIWQGGGNPASPTTFARASIPHSIPPVAATHVDTQRKIAAAHAHVREVADEGKAIADAYRQAQMDEYLQRRQKISDRHDGERVARVN